MKAYVFLFLCFSLSVNAQDSLTVDQRLIFYADVMVNAIEPSNRQYASEIFESDFYTFLAEDYQFEDKLPCDKFVSVLEAEDKVFKIISWQVALEEGNYHYGGCLLFRDGSIVKLQDTENLERQSAYELFTPDRWYGALYYNMMKHTDDQYLLFGYNANGIFENSKVVDLLSINDQEISFGGEIFEDKESLGTYNNRIVISYSADASVNLNYNPGLAMIVQDHLMQRMGRLPNQGPTWIPDGTYEGYFLEDGYWKYKEKLFNHSYGENNAPRPMPIFKDN